MVSLIGIIIAMIEDTTEETVLTAVIGELVFRSFLNSYFGLASFPPNLKYMIVTIIDETMQAMLSDKAVLFVSDISRKVVSKSKTIAIILTTCSINSVKLMIKNFCSPQSAPRSTSYIELKIKAGSKIFNISVEALEVNIIFNRFGKNIIIMLANTQMMLVKIRPEETIEPIARLSFFPE